MHFLVVRKGVRNGSRGRRSDHHRNGEESRLLDGLRGQMEAAFLHVANNVLRFKHARKKDHNRVFEKRRSRVGEVDALNVGHHALHDLLL